MKNKFVVSFTIPGTHIKQFFVQGGRFTQHVKEAQVFDPLTHEKTEDLLKNIRGILESKFESESFAKLQCWMGAKPNDITITPNPISEETLQKIHTGRARPLAVA